MKANAETAKRQIVEEEARPGRLFASQAQGRVKEARHTQASNESSTGVGSMVGGRCAPRVPFVGKTSDGCQGLQVPAGQVP